MARGTVDWVACEADYRIGTFSNRQLAEIHKCDEKAIRDRVKRYGWVKDLSQAVRQATAAKLLGAEVRTSPRADNDAEIVNQGSELRAAVVRGHQKLLSDTLAKVMELLAAPRSDNRRDEASVIRDLSAALGRLIPLERQAFNLDDPVSKHDVRAQAVVITAQMTPQEAADAYAAFLRSGETLPALAGPCGVSSEG